MRFAANSPTFPMSSNLSTTNSAIAEIAAQFESRFREKRRPIRKVGREAEFPLVTRDGRAADVSCLWEPLLAEKEFTPIYNNPARVDLIVAVERDELNIAIEVGRGTIELSLGPYDDLWQLQTAYDQAVASVVRAAESRGLLLLGFGIQPRTPASAALMTPRPRYRALYRAIGAPWLRLTTTAADQTHVDIARAELLDAINWMNLLSAPLIALCANSSVYAGRAGQFLSGREGLLRDLGQARYGMTPRRFDDLEEFIRYLCDYRCFILPEGSGFKQINRPFAKYLSRSAESKRFDEFLFHEHYVWNSARARVANSTIEVRPACQPPPGESLAANALILGWGRIPPRGRRFFRRCIGKSGVAGHAALSARSGPRWAGSQRTGAAINPHARRNRASRPLPTRARRREIPRPGLGARRAPRRTGDPRANLYCASVEWTRCSKRSKYARRDAQMLKLDLLLFDIDGVLIDVSQSYRNAIRLTVQTYLQDVLGLLPSPDALVSHSDVAAFKLAGRFQR